MAGTIDLGLKYLFWAAQQVFVGWLLAGSGSRFVEELQTKLVVSNNQHVDADILYRVVSPAGELLLHIEFQRGEDDDMARRMWRYNALADCQHALPVHSVLIYLLPCQVVRSPYQRRLPWGRKTNSLEFDVICMWLVPTDEMRLLAQRSPVVLPLLVLTREGARRDVVEEALTGLGRADLPQEIYDMLFYITYVMASRVLTKKADREWLERRFNMEQREELLWQFPKHREFVRRWTARAEQEARQEGLQQGLQEGLQQGLQQNLRLQRQILVELVGLRFPESAAFAKEAAERVDSLEALHHLIVNVGIAPNEAMVRQLLQDARDNMN